jgi:hypothetical protein
MIYAIEEICLLGYNAVQSLELPPTYLAYSSNLKI